MCAGGHGSMSESHGTGLPVTLRRPSMQHWADGYAPRRLWKGAKHAEGTGREAEQGQRSTSGKYSTGLAFWTLTSSGTRRLSSHHRGAVSAEK